jgi:hypothetical protein
MNLLPRPTREQQRPPNLLEVDGNWCVMMYSYRYLQAAIRFECPSVIRKLIDVPVPVMYISPLMVDTLVRYYFKLTPEHMHYAVKHGHLNMVQSLVYHNVPLDRRTGRLAVLHGHLRIVKYLHFKRFVWDADICLRAAHCTNPDIMRFLHERGYALPKGVFWLACRKRNDEVIRYLMKHPSEI